MRAEREMEGCWNGKDCKNLKFPENKQIFLGCCPSVEVGERVWWVMGDICHTLLATKKIPL